MEKILEIVEAQGVPVILENLDRTGHWEADLLSQSWLSNNCGNLGEDIEIISSGPDQSNNAFPTSPRNPCTMHADATRQQVNGPGIS